jgi:gamma-glutamyl-gamma-aminobutyrate hydrolase PuuD
MKLYLSTFFLVITFLIKVQWNANASTLKSEKCELPTHQTLQIACTTDCGKFNTNAILRFAKQLGYKVQLTNIYTENQTPDISKFDAILIPGGADINPDYYINEVEPELQDHIRSIDYLVDYTSEGRRRDPFEYNLLQNYFSSRDRNIFYTPVLGICRGMQMLTVSQGIPLYIDIKKELGIANRRYKIDKITINNSESVIADIMKRKQFRAVELHHQGLRVDYFNKHRNRWPQLDVTATSWGGKIAEVLEFYNRPVLGVQYHPEYTYGVTRRETFKWFLQRACMKKNMGL